MHVAPQGNDSAHNAGLHLLDTHGHERECVDDPFDPRQLSTNRGHKLCG